MRDKTVVMAKTSVHEQEPDNGRPQVPPIRLSSSPEEGTVVGFKTASSSDIKKAKGYVNVDRLVSPLRTPADPNDVLDAMSSSNEN